MNILVAGVLGAPLTLLVMVQTHRWQTADSLLKDIIVSAWRRLQHLYQGKNHCSAVVAKSMPLGPYVY